MTDHTKKVTLYLRCTNNNYNKQIFFLIFRLLFDSITFLPLTRGRNVSDLQLPASSSESLPSCKSPQIKAAVQVVPVQITPLHTSGPYVSFIINSKGQEDTGL